MHIETVRTEGPGATYVLAHDGLGLIVDPQRDVDRFTSVVAGSHRAYAPDLAAAPPGGLNRSKPVLVACETGYKAPLAASMLQGEGYLSGVLVGAGIPEVIAAT